MQVPWSNKLLRYELIAHHEAGHAVMVVRKDWPLAFVTINPDSDLFGGVRNPSPSGGLTSHEFPSEIAKLLEGPSTAPSCHSPLIDIQDAIDVLLVPYVFVRVFIPQLFDSSHFEDDCKKALRLIEALESEDVESSFQPHCDRIHEQILTEDVNNDIKEIAALLLERGSLVGDVVISALGRTNG